MMSTEPVNVDWQTSTFCGSTTCVQVAVIDGSIAVRDSKDPGGAVLKYTPEEWHAFLDGVTNGDFTF